MNKKIEKDIPGAIINKNPDFVKNILNDVTGINLSEQEINKLGVFLRYETTSESLFSNINTIYGIISANFKDPSRFLIIPFIKDGREHINIQKI